MRRTLGIRGKTLLLRGYGYVDVGRLVRVYGADVAREVLRQLAAGSRRAC